MPRLSALPPHWGRTFALVSLLLLAGCQSCGDEDQPPPDAVTARDATAEPDPQVLATQFMRFAYQGALLRSDHPLNDSLSAILAGPVGGQELTVIDTFHVRSSERVGDGQHVVRVQVPHAVTIKSVTWDTSSPVADKTFTLRTVDNKIQKAPHVVGWPAFQRHIRNVAPEDADAVQSDVGSKLNESPESPS